jgi:hypothetical protein
MPEGGNRRRIVDAVAQRVPPVRHFVQRRSDPICGETKHLSEIGEHMQAWNAGQRLAAADGLALSQRGSAIGSPVTGSHGNAT